MRKNFRATDLGRCETRLYIEFTKPKSGGQVPEEVQQAFDTGVRLHNEVIAEYKKAGTLKRQALYVFRELHLSFIKVTGEIDCTIDYDRIETVVEIKSINHNDFLGLVGPLLDHRLQLMFYLDRTFKRSGLLIYIDKKKTEAAGGVMRHEKKVYEVEYDAEEIENQYKWLDNLWMKNIKTKTAPERRATLCRECIRCYLKDECKKIGEGNGKKK